MLLKQFIISSLLFLVSISSYGREHSIVYLDINFEDCDSSAASFKYQLPLVNGEELPLYQKKSGGYVVIMGSKAIEGQVVMLDGAYQYFDKKGRLYMIQHFDEGWLEFVYSFDRKGRVTGMADYSGIVDQTMQSIPVVTIDSQDITKCNSVLIRPNKVNDEMLYVQTDYYPNKHYYHLDMNAFQAFIYMYFGKKQNETVVFPLCISCSSFEAWLEDSSFHY